MVRTVSVKHGLSSVSGEPRTPYFYHPIDACSIPEYFLHVDFMLYPDATDYKLSEST